MSAPAGPYIVTRREGRRTTIRYPQPPLSRWAYATLEEVRAAMRRIVTERLPFDTAEGIKAVIDARIANASFLKRSLKLPDGSEIVVETTTWGDLILARTGDAVTTEEMSMCEARAALLAAWNAEHGIRIEARS